MTNTKTRNNRNIRHSRHKHTRRRNTNAKEDIRKDNFYLWANQKWLNEVPKTLPRELKYIRPLDNFKLIQDEMYRNTLTMVREYTRDSKTSDALSRQMKNIAASFRDLHPEPVLSHISKFCKLYNELICENNLYKFLGIMNQNEMIKWALPVTWTVYPDEYTPGKLSAHIGSPSLSLYDYRFYLSDSIIEKQMRGVRLNTSNTTVIRQDEQGGGGGGGGGGGRKTKHKNGVVSDEANAHANEGGPETKTVEYMKYKKRITTAFLRFIEDIFSKCIGRDYETTHNIKVQDVYDIECALLSCMNMIDPRFDDSYANIYQSATQRDKPPHLSGLNANSKKNSKIHRRCDCETGINETTENMEERLKLPHYKNNIRGSTRVLTQDAMCLTGIDWREMGKWIGYGTGGGSGGSSSSSVPPYFIANQVGYLNTVMTLLKKEWASDKWKSYWYFIYFRQLICFHDKWRDIYLDFNDTLIRGKETHFPREYFPIIGLAYAFPKTMTEEFTKRYKNEEMIEKVREIGNTMLECYKDRINRNTWMSAYTKKGALKKLNTIKLKIGESNLSAPDPTTLDYDPKDAWGNLLKRSVQRMEYIAKHHQSAPSDDGRLSSEDLDVMNWGTMKLVGYQSFVVNAYYTPNSNSIYIPTAYMHSMNVQFGRGYEYDLASVGFTFGHEISHALHVNSRIYNHKGVIKNWWSKDDTATYERKIAAIRRQYEEVSRKDGFVIDGNLSLSENLADVTGIAICEDALNKYHHHVYDDVTDMTRDEHIRRSSFLNFYTYYAIQNRQYANFREILVQVLTNPHLNLKIRTNVPLMRSKTFRDVLEIKKSDKMYNDEFDVVF
jgi:predicted metalloendopeptidase